MTIFSKNTVEFVTVAVQYCLYLEQAAEKPGREFISVMQKILPLLYLKAALVEKPVPGSQDDPAGFVTEEAYNQLQQTLEKVMGRHDAFFDGETAASVSENLCDIYQDLKDFIECYRQGQESVSADALFYCIDNFETYWGRKLLQTVMALHNVMYDAGANSDDYDSEIPTDN